MNQIEDEIARIHRRQLARLLAHLDRKGMLTAELAQDLKRSFGFAAEDFRALHGHDTETSHARDQR